MKKKGRRRFFWLVIFLFVFVVSQAAAIEITQVGKVVAPHPNTNQEFLILISDNFWQVPEVQKAIERYQNDVYQHRQVGSRVFMVSPAEIPFGSGSGCGGDVDGSAKIREFLKDQYYSNSGLVGVILIGDLPWVNIMTPNYTFGVCDVYFGELDFEGWTIVDQQECHCHYLELPYCAGGGCIHPEIWVSRIFPPVCFDFFLGR
ncbi:hypothetical protein J7J41_00575, partial [bacterium]|nr:hypothetical protein [bacterium]